MHNFTVFSIILSLSVVLIIGDVIFHDYLSANSSVVVEEVVPDNSQTNLLSSFNEPVVADVVDEVVEEIQVPEVKTLDSGVNKSLFVSAGFENAVLKETVYSGLIFQFIPFADQDSAEISQVNLFNGENFVGSAYEIKYSNETGSFQGYLSLRERASALDFGLLNEVNNFGDASFYFNHNDKTKTVHVVMREGATIYAFEYPFLEHEKMTGALEFLGF